MKRKKRKSRWKKRLCLTGVGVSVVLLALALYMAFRADCLLPEGMYRQLVPVIQEDMDLALPKGSLAVVNELETPHERGVAAYQTSDGQVAFGRVKEETVEGYTLGFDQEDETFQVKRKQVLGSVCLRSGRTGDGAFHLSSHPGRSCGPVSAFPGGHGVHQRPPPQSQTPPGADGALRLLRGKVRFGRGRY